MTPGVLTHMKARWRELRQFDAGERFERFHVAEQQRSRWVKVAYLGAALALLPVGVLFAFIPGPAFLFFALSAALFATHSLWFAKRLDRGELALRKAWLAKQRWWRAWRARHHPPDVPADDSSSLTPK
jgi:hypothetical protein